MGRQVIIPLPDTLKAGLCSGLQPQHLPRLVRAGHGPLRYAGYLHQDLYLLPASLGQLSPGYPGVVLQAASHMPAGDRRGHACRELVRSHPANRPCVIIGDYILHQAQGQGSKGHAPGHTEHELPVHGFHEQVLSLADQQGVVYSACCRKVYHTDCCIIINGYINTACYITASSVFFVCCFVYCLPDKCIGLARLPYIRIDIYPPFYTFTRTSQVLGIIRVKPCYRTSYPASRGGLVREVITVTPLDIYLRITARCIDP